MLPKGAVLALCHLMCSWQYLETCDFFVDKRHFLEKRMLPKCVTQLATLLGLVCSVFLLSATKASAGVDYLSYSLNDMSILIINDTENRFAAKLFPTLDTYPDAKNYLVDGSFAGIVRTFAIKNGKRTILVDGGWGTESGKRGRTREILAQVGISANDITDILLTHLDIDHVSGLVENNAPVFANATLRLCRKEYDAWIVQGHVRNEASEKRAKAVVALYEKAGRLSLFNWGDEVLPGITALDAAGHTPGHTAFTLTSKGASLVLLGDLLHAADLQLMHPNVNSVYDHDPARAAEARNRILSRCAQEKLAVAGAHILPIGIPSKMPKGGFVLQ